MSPPSAGQNLNSQPVKTSYLENNVRVNISVNGQLTNEPRIKSFAKNSTKKEIKNVNIVSHGCCFAFVGVIEPSEIRDLNSRRSANEQLQNQERNFSRHSKVND
jgi:hypothetical protein